MSNTATRELLYSSLGDDPDLGEIVTMFVDEMPDRIDNLLKRLELEDWTGLERAAHQLRGAAGSYGFDALTPQAGILERAVRERRQEESIRQAVESLIELCRQTRAGSPP
jgi:HPt (histidine-containing phosphotransfer) domain-containing protein